MKSLERNRMHITIGNRIQKVLEDANIKLASVRRRLWVDGLVVSILGVLLASSAAAQEFRQVPGTLNLIAAGARSVWGATGSELYRYDASTHLFAQVPNVSNQIIEHIAVGGGTLIQPDEVWLATLPGQVYRFNPTSHSFDQMPASLFAIAVGPGYHSCHRAEVWGIGNDGIVRFNYCTGLFEQVPGSLDRITVGDGEVWGENSSGQTYKFDFDTGTFAYVYGVDSAGLETLAMYQIAAGGDGAVWGIGTPTPNNTDTYSIYRVGYVPICIGSDCLSYYWYATPGPQGWLYAGGEGIWLIRWTYFSAISGPVYRFDESSQGFVPVKVEQRIDKSIPAFHFIAVGSGAGVWALDDESHIYVYESQ